MEDDRLKQRTARSVKWNAIDRIATQILYAVTGVILARELSQEAFGLIGALLVFQAFALLFVDSGFSYALIQRKRPTETDYSSVFWFNLIIAFVAYIILWFAAPLISRWFGGDPLLIPLSRVMFLSFIINATAIVQTNRLMKQMNFRPLTIINTFSLIVGAITGIWMAFAGYGPWAIVWQTISINASKSLCLWIYCRWMPLKVLSVSALKSFWAVGSGMMMTSFLNVLFQNIYAFFIGNRAGIIPLGYYTQADKWSKMGITAISQTLTSSFLPTLSEVQDDPERFRRIVSKMNRFTAYLMFPVIFFLIVMATPVFHVLFGQKWDAAIILFRLLLVRGIFVILNSLYTNYILSLGKSSLIFRLEVFRDVIALIGIVVTLPFITLSTPVNPVLGLSILLAGQILATFITWIITLIFTARATGITVIGYLRDLMPYFVISSIISVGLWLIGLHPFSALTLLIIQILICISAYLIANFILHSRIQSELLAHIFRRQKRHDAPKTI